MEIVLGWDWTIDMSYYHYQSPAMHEKYTDNNNNGIGYLKSSKEFWNDQWLRVAGCSYAETTIVISDLGLPLELIFLGIHL